MKFNNLFSQSIIENYFKNLLYKNNTGKTTYFDRINNVEETEFDLETPIYVEDQQFFYMDLKTFIISCR